MATLTTSGTDTFQLSVDEILEQALEPLGGEHTSGIEASKARRALNLLLIELQNKNIPISKLTTIPLTLQTGVATYTLDPSVVDVLQTTVSLTGITPVLDLLIQRSSLKKYQEIPNKLQKNRPNTYVTNRLDTGVTITYWPVPDLSTYTSKLLCSVKIEDVNAAFQTIDLPTRYLPLLVAWLSYKLSLTRPMTDPTLRQVLQAEYKEILQDTFEEDRERSDMTIVPGGISGR